MDELPALSGRSSIRPNSFPNLLLSSSLLTPHRQILQCCIDSLSISVDSSHTVAECLSRSLSLTGSLACSSARASSLALALSFVKVFNIISLMTIKSAVMKCKVVLGLNPALFSPWLLSSRRALAKEPESGGDRRRRSVTGLLS